MTKTKRRRSRREGGHRKLQLTSPARLRARQHQLAIGRYKNLKVCFEHIGEYYDDVLVTLECDERAVAAIRALPHWAQHWDATSKVWRIHPGYAERLADDLESLGCSVGGGW